MGKVKIYCLIVLMLNVPCILCGPEDEHLCCPADQYIVRKKSITYCYEPKANVTTSLSLECGNSTVVAPKLQINYYVNDDSQLLLQYRNFETQQENGTYCLGTLMSLKNQSNHWPVAILCNKESVRLIDEDVFGYCMIVSCVFLFLTAVIYIALPELRDLQGKSIINLCVSMALGFSILAAMKLVAYSDMTLCAIRGFLVYFFIIAGFFWTNVISIQIMLKMRRPSISTYSWIEFTWYAAYAWGAAAALTVAMAVVNFMPGDHIRPGIGLNHCWFFSTKQQWQYMYSVMTILIVANICIFVHTSVLLWKYNFDSKHLKAVRYKFLMTLRLCIVMGLPWIFEMLGTVSSHVMWEILDIINTLQGVYIFLVVVVMRRRVVQCAHRRGWLSCAGVAALVERWLAVGDNDEDEVEHTTIGVALENVKE